MNADDMIWEEVKEEVNEKIVIPELRKSFILPHLIRLRERAFLWRIQALTRDKCRAVVWSVADAVWCELDRRF
jgi:hypothetical protein